MGDTNYFTVWVKYCLRPKSLTMGDTNYSTVWVIYLKSLLATLTILLYELNTAYHLSR